jgi:hypothetical protein
MPQIPCRLIEIGHSGGWTVAGKPQFHLFDHRADSVPRENCKLVAAFLDQRPHTLERVSCFIFDDPHRRDCSVHLDDSVDAQVTGGLDEQRKVCRETKLLVVFEYCSGVGRARRRQRDDAIRPVLVGMFCIFPRPLNVSGFVLNPDDQGCALSLAACENRFGAGEPLGFGKH